MTGAPAPRVSPGRTPQCGLMRAWPVSVSSGELAGFCFPALVGGLLREETPRFVLGAMVLAFTAGGAFVLLVTGVAQWTELRRHVPHAARWIALTAAGAGAGLLTFTAVTTPLWQPGQGTLSVAAVGVLGGGLMAVAMAAVTGLGLRRLLAARPQPSAGAGSGALSLSLAGGSTNR